MSHGTGGGVRLQQALPQVPAVHRCQTPMFPEPAFHYGAKARQPLAHGHILHKAGMRGGQCVSPEGILKSHTVLQTVFVVEETGIYRSYVF